MASILDKLAIRNAALPISVQQYQQLGQHGIIASNTELIRGVIIEKMIKSPRHSWLVQHLVQWLRSDLSADFHVRQEQPLTLSDSEPEPDVAVVAGSADAYRDQHPQAASLVIEVSISSEDLDREKSSLYAEAGVDEYWIVLPDHRTVEVLSQPSETGYQSHETYTSGDSISCRQLPLTPLDVDGLFS